MAKVVTSTSQVVGIVINVVDDWLSKGDQDVGPWSPDDSGRAAHALRRGDVRCGAR